MKLPKLPKMKPTSVGYVSAMVLLGGSLLMGGGLIAFDIWVYHEWGVDATISRGWLRIGHQWPAIPFIIGIIIGVLIGHFWASQGQDLIVDDTKKTSKPHHTGGHHK